MFDIYDYLQKQIIFSTSLQILQAPLTSLSAVHWLSPRVLLVLLLVSLVRGGFQVRSPVALL